MYIYILYTHIVGFRVGAWGSLKIRHVGGLKRCRFLHPLWQAKSLAASRVRDCFVLLGPKWGCHKVGGPV